MIKSFNEYLNESENSYSFNDFVYSGDDSAADHLENMEDEPEEMEDALDGYTHLLSYFYEKISPTPHLPKVVVMEFMQHIITIGSPNANDETRELLNVVFPGLIGEYGQINVDCDEIWHSEYWEGSPGANSIDALTHEGVKICFWQDAGDGPFVYLKPEDLLKAMNKRPESLKMFPDAVSVLNSLSNSSIDIQGVLHKYRGKIGSNKYGL